MKDEWRSLEEFGYSGYDISSTGAIRSYWKHGLGGLASDPQRVMKTSDVGPGYLQLRLRHDEGRKRRVYIHHLVALAFIGERPPGHEICHYDNNKKNNSVDNLRYGPPADNAADRVRHGTTLRGEKNPNVRLRECDIPVIRALCDNESVTHKDIANMFNVSRRTIGHIKNKSTWAYI